MRNLMSKVVDAVRRMVLRPELGRQNRCDECGAAVGKPCLPYCYGYLGSELHREQVPLGALGRAVRVMRSYPFGREVPVLVEEGPANLVCDLMHLVAEKGGDPHELLERAGCYYSSDLVCGETQAEHQAMAATFGDVKAAAGGAR